MTITCCNICQATYDDASCWTICPHERFISPESAAQKDAAYALLRKTVVFNHMPDGPDFRVTSINHIGMMTLDGLAGEFAPHLFKEKACC